MSKCEVPWKCMLVYVDGSVRACCYQKGSLGNMKTSTYEEIWNGPYYKAMRECIKKGDYDSWCREVCPVAYPYRQAQDKQAGKISDNYINPAQGVRQVIKGMHQLEIWNNDLVFWTEKTLEALLKPAGDETKLMLKAVSGLKADPADKYNIGVKLINNTNNEILADYSLKCDQQEEIDVALDIPRLENISETRLLIDSDTFVPNEISKSGDLRTLGIVIKGIYLC